MTKSKFNKLLWLPLMACLAAMAVMMPVANADTNNFPLTQPVNVIAFHVSGQYTATTAGVVRFKLPFAAKVINVTAAARASGGTTPTLTVDLKNGGTTILSAPFAVTAGASSEAASVTSPNIADESVVTVDFTIGGTSPTWNDITILLTVIRR